jgi:HAMP domain-containing protein
LIEISIRLKYFATLAIVMSITAFSGWYMLSTAENALSDAVFSSLTTLAESKEQTAYAYIDSLEQRMASSNTNLVLAPLLGEFSSSANGTEASAKSVDALNNYLDLRAAADSTVASIFIATLDGRVIAATNKSQMGMDESGERIFQAGKTRPTLGTLGEEHKTTGDTEEFTIYAPISDPASGKAIAVISTIYTTGGLSRIFSNQFEFEKPAFSELVPRKTLEVYMVNRKRQIFIHILAPNSTNGSWRDSMGPHSVGLALNHPAVEKCLVENMQFSGTYADQATGKEIVSTSMCFPKQGWTLLVEMDAEEAFAPLKRMQYSLLIAAMVAVFFTFALAYLLSRDILGPIEKLTRSIDELSKGNLNITIEDTKRTDEIGSLAASFDRMLVSLKLAMMQTAPEMKKQSDALRQALREKDEQKKPPKRAAKQNRGH